MVGIGVNGVKGKWLLITEIEYLIRCLVVILEIREEDLEIKFIYYYI